MSCCGVFTCKYHNNYYKEHCRAESLEQMTTVGCCYTKEKIKKKINRYFSKKSFEKWFSDLHPDQAPPLLV